MPQPDLLLMVLFGIGCAQGVFLCLMLGQVKSSNPVAIYCPALLVLVCVVIIAEEWAELAGLPDRFPHLLHSTMLAPFLFGPLLLFHAQALATGKRHLSRADLFHAIPIVLALMYFAPLYLESSAAKRLMLQAGEPGVDIVVLAYLKGVHVVFYLSWALWLLHRAVRRRPEGRPAPKHLVWLRRIIVVAFVGVAGIYALLTLMLSGITWTMDSDQFGSVFMATIIYLQAFVVIKYPAFVKAPLESSVAHALARANVPTTPGAALTPAAALAAADVSVARSPQYANSSLTRAQGEVYLEQLKAYMDGSKPFRDSEVRLADVAKAVSLTPHHLSQVINDSAGMTFRDFINVYRIEEVKRKLRDPGEAHKSILALAVESGFGNKSSFNRAFKLHTGVTPSAYRMAEPRSIST